MATGSHTGESWGGMTTFHREPPDTVPSHAPPAPRRARTLSRRRLVQGAAALTAAPLVLGAAGQAAARPAVAHPKPRWITAVRRELSALVAAEHLPGAQAVLTDAYGRTHEVTAGAGDLATGRPYPHLARLRVASHTKSFVATAVLGLAAEGRVELAAPVERYLPGVVRGNGNDGRRITVRQLLQHTSGLPEFAEGLDEHSPGFHRPEEVVERALRQPPRFPPGTKWEYCNTGYVVLGMLVERVAGRPYAREVERRVITRAGLPHTHWPRWPEQGLRGPHAKAYTPEPGGGHREITFINTSVVGAAGALVSTAQDLTAFYRALLGGRLLPRRQIALMKDTVPADIARGARYGLGLARYPLGPGTGADGYWGHGGTISGTRTRGGITDDGRAVFIAVNEVSENPEGSQAVIDTVERVFRHLPSDGRDTRREGGTPS